MTKFNQQYYIYISNRLIILFEKNYEKSNIYLKNKILIDKVFGKYIRNSDIKINLRKIRLVQIWKRPIIKLVFIYIFLIEIKRYILFFK